MTEPVFANAAMAGSSLLIQNAARRLSTQVQQTPPAPLIKAQEYVAICTFGILIAMLLLAFVVIIRITLDLFR